MSTPTRLDVVRIRTLEQLLRILGTSLDRVTLDGLTVEPLITVHEPPAFDVTWQEFRGRELVDRRAIVTVFTPPAELPDADSDTP